MERKVTKLENCHTEILVTVDEATWKEAQNKAFSKVAAKITVPGFRKGKAPANLVKDKVNQVEVMDTAINSLLPELYKEVLTEENIRPYAQPSVDVTKLSDTELEVKFVIVTAPEVELGQYTGLEVGKVAVEVTDEEVEKAVESTLAQSASLVLKEGAAAEGDTVVIDFEGRVDGEVFDGGTATNYELVLGSHTFIPGFEEQLVGKSAGEEVDVNVTFPHEYHEALT
jgi:trigger factor